MREVPKYSHQFTFIFPLVVVRASLLDWTFAKFKCFSLCVIVSLSCFGVFAMSSKKSKTIAASFVYFFPILFCLCSENDSWQKFTLFSVSFYLFFSNIVLTEMT